MAFIKSIVALSIIAVARATEPVAIRQVEGVEPGTNLYNCHDNCGEAILEEANAGFCNTTIFQQDYAACLQCSGPDNENIWSLYGPYLTAGAAECGSATVPLTGTQANVSTALIAPNSTSAAATTTPTGSVSTTASSGATKTSSSATQTSSTAAATSSSAALQQFKVAGGLTLAAIFAVAVSI